MGRPAGGLNFNQSFDIFGRPEGVGNVGVDSDQASLPMLRALSTALARASVGDKLEFKASSPRLPRD